MAKNCLIIYKGNLKMDKIVNKIVISESQDKETKDESESKKPSLNGNGLLQLIHDTVENITSIIEEVRNKVKSDDDGVEFEKDSEDDCALDASPIQDLMPLPMISEPFSMELLNDKDFDDTDPVVQTFKNDMGGCGGMIKILKISGPEAVEKLAMVYEKLNKVRIAHRAQVLGEIFQHINDMASGKGAIHQLSAIRKIERLAADSNPNERFALLKAKDSILAGTPEHFDAAGYRVRGVFSQYAPESMVRTAYTNLETQAGDLIMLPQGKHQLGHPVTLELSKFRDNSVDAKIDPQTGDVKNGYADFERRRDSSESVKNRFEVHRNPVNDESLLTLAKDERSKPLTKNERNYEQRLDEDTKNRYNEKSWTKSREEMLADTSEANLGHHGEPKEDESIARTLSKTAKKYDKVDPESEDTMGEQIAAGHAPTPDDITLEEMLNDERVGLTDEELDMLLEEWFEKAREN